MPMQPDAHKMIPSPIKWVGGKRRLRERIISLIPPHSCYVELFSGGAWVLFGKKPSDVEILNDIDGELINFYHVIKNRPEELIAEFEMELVSRQIFESLAEADFSQMTSVQRAHRLFYIIMAGWGGELNYPRFQTSISDGGHGNRLIGAIKNLRKRIMPVHGRLRTVIIENLAWESCMDRYDKDERVFMYIDPPYPDNKVNYLHNMRNWEEHKKLAKRLKSSECRWILSSFDTQEVRDMYKGFNIIPVEAFSGMDVSKDGGGRVKNMELLIMNYDPALATGRWDAPQMEVGSPPLNLGL